MKICKVVGCNAKLRKRGYCDKHYQKKEVTSFGFLGKHINIYTNGVTEKIKPLIPKIKNDVLNDCIKNPRKYLE